MAKKTKAIGGISIKGTNKMAQEWLKKEKAYSDKIYRAGRVK